MELWKVVEHSGTQQSGPAKAMDEVVKDLEDKGIDYEVFEFEVGMRDDKADDND